MMRFFRPKLNECFHCAAKITNGTMHISHRYLQKALRCFPFYFVMCMERFQWETRQIFPLWMLLNDLCSRCMVKALPAIHNLWAYFCINDRSLAFSKSWKKWNRCASKAFHIDVILEFLTFIWFSWRLTVEKREYWELCILSCLVVFIGSVYEFVLPNPRTYYFSLRVSRYCEI